MAKKLTANAVATLIYDLLFASSAKLDAEMNDTIIVLTSSKQRFKITIIEVE